MKRLQAFKFDLRPNGEQRRQMGRYAGCCRFVYKVVGAMNLLARGHRVLACGEASSGLGHEAKTKPASMKQKPAEETERSAAATS